MELLLRSLRRFNKLCALLLLNHSLMSPGSHPSQSGHTVFGNDSSQCYLRSYLKRNRSLCKQTSRQEIQFLLTYCQNKIRHHLLKVRADLGQTCGLQGVRLRHRHSLLLPSGLNHLPRFHFPQIHCLCFNRD